MSRSEFDQIVRDVMRPLPPEIRKHLENVVVETADEPDHDLLLSAGLTEVEIEAGESLLGLFEPMELPLEDVDFPDAPHKLWVFRLPHQRQFENESQMRTEVRKTVVHELAHHFGWTDRDLERFDNTPDPFHRPGPGT